MHQEVCMASPNRTPFQIERDRQEITRRYLRGETQAAIGEALGMTRQMVGYDLKAIQEAWQKASLIDFNAAKGRELAKVDELERTYWQAWDESKQEKTQTSTKKKQTGKGEDAKTEAAIKREKRDGNPAFLAGVQWCIERRCKLLGIDAPTKIAPTDPSGEKEYAGITDADLLRELASILDAARARTASTDNADNPV